MISFKQFITEKSDSFTLYRHINDVVADALLAGKSVPVRTKFTSFVKNKSELKSEFGNRIIAVESKDLPSGTDVIELQYDLAWFTASPLRKQLLKMATGRTEQDWLDEFDGDFEDVDDEFETIYGDEHEVVVTGLNSFDPKIFKVLK